MYTHDPCGESVDTIAKAFVHLQVCRMAALTYRIPRSPRRRVEVPRLKG